MIKLLLALTLLGAPDYKTRTNATDRMCMFAGTSEGLSYQECKYLYKHTKDPEIKWRLEKVARRAWNQETKDKYSVDDFYGNRIRDDLQTQHYKEDWKR